MLNRIEGIRELADNYDTFFVDVWGVVHNGKELLPHVVETFTKLKEQQKKIILFTNSPRQEHELHSKLADFGLEQNLYDAVCSSGELFKYCMHDLKEDYGFHCNPLREEIFKNIEGYYYYIGVGERFIFEEQFGLKQVHDFATAEIAILNNLSDDFDFKTVPELTKKMLEHSVILLCLNPDANVMMGETEIYCPGYIAQKYEAIGGKVIYFGKPFNHMYELGFVKAINNEDASYFKSHNKVKQKICAIGDNIHTDIAGALLYDIDSCLVLSGVFAYENRAHDLINAANSKIKHMKKELDIHSTSNIMVTDGLKW